jgi:acyl-CoA thioester hydrolase
VVEYEHSFTVTAGDIDQQGHVNNVRYVQWIQDVAVAHWRDLATPEQLSGVTWVVLRHEIDYLRPAFEGEELTARTWVGRAWAARSERFTEVRRGGEILVRAKSVWCALDAKTFRPRRIDGDIKEKFGMTG